MKALSGLAPEGRSVTRGTKETQVYQVASPSVVLIVTKDGLGSGVLVGADGRIVTNLHVVDDYAEVGVIFKPTVEGAKIGEADVVTAKVLRRDEVADLALIQVAVVPAHANDDGDGRYDTVIVDGDRDGNPDLALYDTDGDGKADLRGDYRNGEDEPYRYERYKG
jgi:hypothetical protein